MSMRDNLDAVLRRATDAGDVPGVVAMLTDADNTLYTAAFGKRALDSGEPMTLDTIGLIASMTKALTSTAILQLTERGQANLDTHAAHWLPELGDVQVLEGFDSAGEPVLRAPVRPITLRHLLTHTSGFGYEFLSEDLQRYQAVRNIPELLSGQKAALDLPLLFDPGESWGYGIGLDWAGLVVEAISGKSLGEYLAEHVMAPLGMTETAFKLTPQMRERMAKIHQRTEDGSLMPLDLEMPQDAEFEMGGGGLYGTVGDYLKFVRMILNGGQGEYGRVLQHETVDLLSRNHIGDLEVGSSKTANPMLTNDFELPPGISHKWGLAAMINLDPLPTGRPAGSLMWAGLANSYFWIDPQTGIAGVMMTQIFPFADVKAMPLFIEFEYNVYQSL
ncbi:serine hydrolase domain-containing protein [Halopseudomonas sp.]|uniref:serine hydrolase domain-containing protein n=1 Tax=Halopseudomonas sp. TaxID=2901191 RepID=UPI0035666299